MTELYIIRLLSAPELVLYTPDLLHSVVNLSDAQGVVVRLLVHKFTTLSSNCLVAQLVATKQPSA